MKSVINMQKSKIEIKQRQMFQVFISLSVSFWQDYFQTWCEPDLRKLKLQEFLGIIKCLSKLSPSTPDVCDLIR